jgi:SAM-dependent methyltransferase
VLEVDDDTYIRRFGGDRVSIGDVLHVDDSNPLATIVADLASADHIPSETFDCIIFTQTLHLIFDVRAAVETLYRILKPGGVLLVTAPGITPIARDRWGEQWYWSFTALSAERLFTEIFPSSATTIEAHGNVLAAIAFLEGLATQELDPVELDYDDPFYQVLITVRATRPPLRIDEVSG